MKNEKKLTVRDFVEAMKKNGYPKIQGSYAKYADREHTEVEGACAYGQAALNLDMSPTALLRKFGDFVVKNHLLTPPNIILLNDRTDMTVTQIGELVEAWAIENNVIDREI